MRPLSFSARSLFSWHSLLFRLLCSSIWAWMSVRVFWKWVVISFLFRSSSRHRWRVSSCQRGAGKYSSLSCKCTSKIFNCLNNNVFKTVTPWESCYVSAALCKAPQVYSGPALLCCAHSAADLSPSSPAAVSSVASSIVSDLSGILPAVDTQNRGFMTAPRPWYYL